MSEFKEALDEYVQSDNYKKGSDPTTLKAPADQRQYLENRLYWAYREGWNAAEELWRLRLKQQQARPISREESEHGDD